MSIKSTKSNIITPLIDQALLYEAVHNIIGTNGTIIPLGDTKHEASSSTLTTVGQQQVTFTVNGTSLWSAFLPTNKGAVPVLTFDGTESELDTPDASFWSTAGGFSIGFWVKLATVASNILLAKWDNTGSARLREWKIYTDSNGDFSGQIYDESENAAVGRKIDTALTADTWVFLVMTFTGGTDAANMIMYKDGAAADDADVVDDAGFANSENLATVVSLGYEEDSSGDQANFLDGEVAGAGIGPFFTPIVLSANQVLRLYEIGRRALEL